MALQSSYTTPDTVEHPECYAKITAWHVDRDNDKIQYDVTLYHNASARHLLAPMSTMYIAGALSDYYLIEEEDVVKKAYVHLKDVSFFSAWSTS